jgi:hypothetical protein
LANPDAWTWKFLYLVIIKGCRRTSKYYMCTRQDGFLSLSCTSLEGVGFCFVIIIS